MADRPVIVDPTGKPARAAQASACPRCDAGADKRIASGGFGAPHPVCSSCGYEWIGQVWRPTGEVS